jgi:transposase-like protein
MRIKVVFPQPFGSLSSGYSLAALSIPLAAECRRSRDQAGYAREVAEDLRTIFNAPDRHTAEAYLDKIVQKYAQVSPTLADWLEKNIPEGLTVFSFPASQRRQLRTANGLELLSRVIKRRTHVVSIFPNEAACLRLISAVLMEIHEEWQADDRVYLTIETSGSLSSP